MIGLVVLAVIGGVAINRKDNSDRVKPQRQADDDYAREDYYY